MSQKLDKKNSELYQAFVPKCSNNDIFYTTDPLKVLLCKNQFYFFLLNF